MLETNEVVEGQAVDVWGNHCGYHEQPWQPEQRLLYKPINNL